MSLSIEGLCSGYGTTQVVRDVTLVVPDGKVVCLLGANGAGKTTLLRTVAGLLAPTRGRVRLGGHDITGLSPHARVQRGLCLVPEGRAIFPNLTVHDNLLLFSPDGEQGIDSALDAFPMLRRKARSLAGDLSGGEQQMVAVSRAFIQRPQFLLLDEVSLGLAPKIVDLIFEALRTLAADGMSTLLVEQYVHKALGMADLACVLDKGTVAFRGAVDELDADRLAATYLGKPVT